MEDLARRMTSGSASARCKVLVRMYSSRHINCLTEIETCNLVIKLIYHELQENRTQMDL